MVEKQHDQTPNSTQPLGLAYAGPSVPCPVPLQVLLNMNLDNCARAEAALRHLHQAGDNAAISELLGVLEPRGPV
jgi:hypothetical protein